MSMRVGSCCQRIDRSSLSTIAAAGVGTVIGVAILTIGILATQGINLPPRPLFGLLSAKTYLLVGGAIGGVSLIFLFSQVIGIACSSKKANSKSKKPVEEKDGGIEETSVKREESADSTDKPKKGKKKKISAESNPGQAAILQQILAEQKQISAVQKRQEQVNETLSRELQQLKEQKYNTEHLQQQNLGSVAQSKGGTTIQFKKTPSGTKNRKNES